MYICIMNEFTIEEMIDLNKKIRNYDGQNTFINSLKKHLSSTRVTKISHNGRNIKILSNKQYEVAKSLL